MEHIPPVAPTLNGLTTSTQTNERRTNELLTVSLEIPSDSFQRGVSSPPSISLTPPVAVNRRSHSLTPADMSLDNKSLVSPQMRKPKIQRRETVDTCTINREDYEVHKI